MLKLTLPEYRLPNAVVDRDIKNITSLGVEIEVNRPIDNLNALKAEGFDALFIGVGTHETTRLNIPGSELSGIVSCLDFLRESKIGKKVDLAGKVVMVIGGGNTAMDAARTAIRLGAVRVSIIYRRSREEMPAWKEEIQEAEEEGVLFQLLRNPVKLIGNDGRINKVVLIKMKLEEPDASGRRKPVEMIGSEYEETVDLVIEAIGLNPTTSPFEKEVRLNKNRTISTDKTTLQTTVPWIFAGGDAVSGSSTIIEAAGQGKRAAFYLDKYLLGLDPGQYEFGDKLPAVDKKTILSRPDITVKPALDSKLRPVTERIRDFRDVELTFTSEEVLQSAGRCLDCSNCRECHQCISACPAFAIDFSQKESMIQAHASAVIIASGYQLFKPEHSPQCNSARLTNVIDSMQMDRLIAPTVLSTMFYDQATARRQGILPTYCALDPATQALEITVHAAQQQQTTPSVLRFVACIPSSRLSF